MQSCAVRAVITRNTRPILTFFILSRTRADAYGRYKCRSLATRSPPRHACRALRTFEAQGSRVWNSPLTATAGLNEWVAYARRRARRALALVSKMRLTMTLALPQFVQRSRLTKEAIGAVESTPKPASAASSKVPSWRQLRHRTRITSLPGFTAKTPEHPRPPRRLADWPNEGSAGALVQPFRREAGIPVSADCQQ